MTLKSRRFWCVALVIAMLAALLPSVAPDFSAKADDATLGMTIVDKVNVRVGPGKNEKYLFLLPINYVCTVLGRVTEGANLWYEVSVKSPEKNNLHVYHGYILGSCFRMLTDAEAAAYRQSQTLQTPTPIPSTEPGQPTPTPTPHPSNTDTPAQAGQTGYITNGGVNLREGPGKTRVLLKLDRGTIVTLLTIPSVISDETYYKVMYNGITGYVMSTFVNPNGQSPVTTLPPSSVTPTPTPAGALGFVQTTKGGVKLRATIGGSTLQTVGRYQTYPYLLPPVKQGGYTWYYVQVGNVKGYLRGDCVKEVGNSQSTPTPTPVVTGTPVTPTPQVTTAPTGYVKTSVQNVNVRRKPGGDKAGVISAKGTVLPYYGTPTTVQGVLWYYVYTKEFKNCYIHGSFVTPCNEYGNPVGTTPTPTPGPGTPTPAATTVTPAPSQKQEASYTTLKLGSSGNAVKNLVTELKKQGYYSGEITDKYTAAVQAAVRAFQTAKGLTVDGIAGSATQHALFNTVPIGSADTTNLTMTIYPAEKIDWNTGGINEMWPRGSNYKIYDVKTGIVWWAHRWAGGLHVDAEPLTAADTARLCRIYGVSKSSEITSKKHYQRRPCLVTIGTRTFACSLYGVPHNYPDGDTIRDNDFKGQVCIHFTNSKTHESRKVDSGHTEAINYAWLNAPNGHI